MWSCPPFPERCSRRLGTSPLPGVTQCTFKVEDNIDKGLPPLVTTHWIATIPRVATTICTHPGWTQLYSIHCHRNATIIQQFYNGWSFQALPEQFLMFMISKNVIWVKIWTLRKLNDYTKYTHPGRIQLYTP